MQNIIQTQGWLPFYQHIEHSEYIFITSLNLGGAEKIVSDQLWANYYSKYPTNYTLIVLYDKEKEHFLPPNTKVFRLNGSMSNANNLLQQISQEKKVLVCHLINNKIAEHLFSYNINISLVVHNDSRSWSLSSDLFNHQQIINFVAVCNYVQKQISQYTNKPVFSLRHQIDYKKYFYHEEHRNKARHEFKAQRHDIVIGMIGRICEQKNYLLAIDILYCLSKNHRDTSYKLVILGGFEKAFTHIYLKMLERINLYQMHEKVILLGFREDAKYLMNGFDIALNTSYFEGLSMATQELMGNGLSIVLSNVCGQSEIYDGDKQLNFFDLPQGCDDLTTLNYNYNQCSSQYASLLQTVSHKIAALGKPERINFSTKGLQKISNLEYASHNVWSLLNHIKPYTTSQEKTIFLTANLNLGGAQKSLVNLLVYLAENKKHLKYIPELVLINQSNQKQFLEQLDNHKISTYICQSSIDVFDIMKNLLTYFHEQHITQIVCWNVESKIKLLLTKFLSSAIKIVDVSPGDYIFTEISNEQDFQEAIYYSAHQNYSSLYQFISKYNFETTNKYLNLLRRPVCIIPNGVYVEPQYLKQKFYTQNEQFKFLVCGRIAPSKHLETIFSAFQNLCSQGYTNIQLEVIGAVDSCYEKYYFELLNNYNCLIENQKITFLGHNETPQEVMKNYDAIVVLGTFQGSPNVVLEAASCKLPIISNDSGGTKEIIDANTGILLPTITSVEELTQAMKLMVDDYPTYIIKAQHCYEKVIENFSMEKMATQYINILNLDSTD